MGVAQAFLPLRQCVRGLRTAVPAPAVKASVKACLHAVRNKVHPRPAAAGLSDSQSKCNAAESSLCVELLAAHVATLPDSI